MRKTRLAIVLGLFLLVVAVASLLALLQHGVSAREKPWAIEAFVARNLRRLAIPRAARQNTNPLPLTPEILAGGRAHFADHCASCHANDGSAVTPMGPNFYPPVPDMRLAETQSLSDGELFYLIENGIRFTGMPAWGTDSPEDDRDTWALVHFIRHLSNLTPEELLEMKALNPRSRRELEEELEIERFLEGEDVNRSSSEHKH